MAKAVQLKDHSGNKIYPISCETGSNSNGNYIKFADGTLICYHKNYCYLDFDEKISDEWYRSSLTNPFTFPVAFIDYPVVQIGGVASNEENITIVSNVTRDLKGIQKIKFVRQNAVMQSMQTIGYIAIGRWK